MSVISCVVTPIYAARELALVAEVRAKMPSAPDPSAGIILVAVLVFLYSDAMAVVFRRVRQLPRSVGPAEPGSVLSRGDS